MKRVKSNRVMVGTVTIGGEIYGVLSPTMDEIDRIASSGSTGIREVVPNVLCTVNGEPVEVNAGDLIDRDIAAIMGAMRDKGDEVRADFIPPPTESGSGG